MGYTKDVFFKLHYKKSCVDSGTYCRNSKIKKWKKKIEEDQYFTVVMIISAIVLFIDFVLLKEFIDTVNLL